MEGACNTYFGLERVLVGKPEGKRPVGIPRQRLQDLQEVGWGT
jgi:hypothetical protein